MNRTDTQPAPLLSGPTSRRDLFRIGGLTLAAGAILVACGGDEADVAQTGGTLAPEPNAFDDTLPPETVVRTLGSIEALLVATYDQIESEGWLADARLTEAFGLFRDHHAEHVTLLADTARELGTQPFEEPNAYLQATVVDPAVVSIQDAVAAEESDEEAVQTAVLDLAYSLENLALQTYVRTSPMLPTAEQRHTAMSIGAVNGRHIAVVLTAERQPLPFALVPVGAAAPAEATIDEDGLRGTPPTTAAPQPTEE